MAEASKENKSEQINESSKETFEPPAKNVEDPKSLTQISTRRSAASTNSGLSAIADSAKTRIRNKSFKDSVKTVRIYNFTVNQMSKFIVSF